MTPARRHNKPAHREIKEEIGYGARELKTLKVLSVAPGYSDYQTHIVLATELYPEKLIGDEPEDIEVLPWPLNELDRLLQRDDFVEARSIAALFFTASRVTNLNIENDRHLAQLTDAATVIARKAGQRILEVYDRGFDIDTKSDGSPVTTADHLAHSLIIEELAKLTPDIPVLSEESSSGEMENRRTWSCYWLIDPLDGTKEFISKRGEFYREYCPYP